MRTLLKGKFVYLVVIMTLTIYSCEYDNPEPIAPDENPVSYSADIQTIFDAGCNGIGCHSVGAIPPDLTTDNSYNSLFTNNLVDTLNPGNSDLYISLSTGSMSGYVTSASDAELILKWIEQGALDN